MADLRPVNGFARFGVFELDVRAGELRKHGIKIKLQEQPFQVLQILIERRGEVVSREELQQRLWPSDTFVEFDKGIYNAIKRLRETLGDTADTPRYIETLPRRGYRFIAPVEGPNGNAPALVEVVSEKHGPYLSRPKLLAALVCMALLLPGVLAVRHWTSARRTPLPPPALKMLALTTNSSEMPVRYAAISPDGKYVAYADELGVHVKVIETGEAASLVLREGSQVVAPAGSHLGLSLAWFPDGTKLLVSGGPAPTIWSVSLLTGKAQKLHEGWAPSVSPDGSWIAFLHGDTEIWLMGPRGEEPRKLAQAEPGSTFGRAFWSPDSRRIAYMRVRSEPLSLECGIESRSLDGGPPSVVLSDKKMCQEVAQGFWWLPDGRIIYSLAEPGTVFRDFNLWEILTDIHTGRPRKDSKRLTNWAGFFLKGLTASADGKRLLFLRSSFQNSVYVGALAPAVAPGSFSPRLLTMEKHGDWPTAWTPDSQALVYYSAKNGDNDIFTQKLDEDSPQPLVTGPGEQLAARLTPDGSSLIYMDVPSFQNFGPGTSVRLMRVRVTGGPAQLVLISHAYDSHRCPRLPTTFCVLSERSIDERRLMFFAFDPMQAITPETSDGGKGRELLSVDTEPKSSYGWDLSPNGSLLAISKTDEHELRIRFVSLKNSQAYEVNLPGWARLNGMDWSADSRSLFISGHSATGTTLLRVDLQGHARALWEERGVYQMWAVPSPDNRRVAILSAKWDCNVWMAENF
jgi:DNA-binding winged helix-turn-helix (wHTH) protein/Tol biopolymer transport system component